MSRPESRQDRTPILVAQAAKLLSARFGCALFPSRPIPSLARPPRFPVLTTAHRQARRSRSKLTARVYRGSSGPALSLLDVVST